MGSYALLRSQPRRLRLYYASADAFHIGLCDPRPDVQDSCSNFSVALALQRLSPHLHARGRLKPPRPQPLARLRQEVLYRISLLLIAPQPPKRHNGATCKGALPASNCYLQAPAHLCTLPRAFNRPMAPGTDHRDIHTSKAVTTESCLFLDTSFDSRWR